MGTWLVILIVGYGLYLMAGCAVQRTMLFPRHMIGEVAAAEQVEVAVREAGGEQWWLETDAGRVEAWFFPGEGVSAESPGPAVLFAHGNAEVIDYLPEQLEPYRRMGVSVLVGEYRGYGRSAGSPSEEGIVADFVELFDRLAAREEVDADRIILHGRSVGSGVVCGVARQREPTVLILQSPFSSVASMAAGYGIPRWFVLDPFDNAAAVAEFDGPILLQHGRNDTIIPHRHSEKLQGVAPHAQLVSYDAGHNDMPILTRAYWRDVRRFLRAHGVIAEPSPAEEPRTLAD